MNKTELVKAIAAKANIALAEGTKGTGSGGPRLDTVEILVNSFIETVSDELSNKGKVTLVGFGTFAVAHRKEKTGVNPKTGEKITIKARHVPVFKPGKTLKDVVK